MSRTGITRLRNLRHGRFERIRYQNTLPGFLAKESADLEGTAAVTAFTADHITNTLTAASHGLEDGDGPYTLSTDGALPTGLDPNLLYYIIFLTLDTFKLSTTKGGIESDFTDNGSGGEITPQTFVTQIDFENAAANVSEFSGNNYTGTITNYTEDSIIDGVVGLGVAIDHSLSQELTFPKEVGQLGKDSPWTLSLWLKIDTRAGILSRQGASTNFKGYSISMTNIPDTGSENQLEFFFGNADGGDQIRVQVDGDILDDAWHMHTITYDGSNTKEGFKFYRDKVLQTVAYELSANTVTGTVIDIDAQMKVSPWGAGVTSIDQLLLFSTELTSIDVGSIYNEGLGLETPLYAPEADLFLPFDVVLEQPVDVSDNQLIESIPNYDAGMYVEGAYKKALNLGNEKLTYLSTGAYDRDQAFTITARVKVTELLGDGVSLDFMDCLSPVTGEGWKFSILQTGVNLRAVFAFTDGTLARDTGIRTLSSTNYFALNTWVTVSIAYDGLQDLTGLRMYINGGLKTDEDFGNFAALVGPGVQADSELSIRGNNNYIFDNIGVFPTRFSSKDQSALGKVETFGRLVGPLRTKSILNQLSHLEAPTAQIFLPFDDVAETPKDISDNNHEAAIPNYLDAMYVNGAYGKAIDLADEKLIYPAALDVGNFTDVGPYGIGIYSVVFKVRAKEILDLTEESVCVMGRRAEDDGGVGWSVLIEGDTPGARIGISTSDGISTFGVQQLIGVTDLEGKDWVSVVITCSGVNGPSAYGIYINGDPSGKYNLGTQVTAVDTNAIDFFIQTDGKLKLDCVGIFPKRLSLDEINAFASSDFGGTTGLIRYADAFGVTAETSMGAGRPTTMASIYELLRTNKPVQIANATDIDDLK